MDRNSQTSYARLRKVGAEPAIHLGKMIAIEDTNHSQSMGEYETLDQAIAELRYLASVPWDHLPNRCPCKSWRKCERMYELIEVDDTQTPYKILRRLLVLKVSRHGGRWISEIEEKWRRAARA